MVASWGDHGPRCTRWPFSPGPPVEKRQRSAFSPPARSCQKGFAVKQAYLFQLDAISLPARDVEYCWKAALCLPARLSLTEQSKKPTYIAEIFRPTCALPLHPLSKSRVWKWMCSFPPVKGKHVFLCLKKKTNLWEQRLICIVLFFPLQWETRSGLFAQERADWLRTFTTQVMLEMLKRCTIWFFTTVDKRIFFNIDFIFSFHTWPPHKALLIAINFLYCCAESNYYSAKST